MTSPADALTTARGRVEAWFAQRGWQPAPFQRAAWEAYLAGQSGLIHSDTGSGKSLAAWLGPVMEALAQPTGRRAGPRVLWITPLRALAADTAANLREPLAELGLDWRVEQRTGDTASSTRQRQQRSPPEALVTTPESLSLMIAYRGAETRLASVDAVIVDEWHELIGSKRGVQLELCLAFLRGLNPDLRTWGLSATLGNLDEAQRTLLGPEDRHGVRIQGSNDKPIRIRSLRPEVSTRFPWAGHLGLHLLPQVVATIEHARSCLLFTNTRSQAERWHEALLAERPEWADSLALHHGSIQRDQRDAVEAGLRDGTLRCVVATSSLDLGVDFSPVDQVIQIGSPKGVARLLQRAGRSGHQPGVTSEVLCVPTHAFELVEIAAARRAQAAGTIEARRPLRRSLDVLAQHLVTVATGDGFRARETLAEVRRTHAFAELTETEWQWVLDFVTQGGAVLTNYPQFRRVSDDGERYRVTDRGIATRHRMAVGTITSDPMMRVQYRQGGSLGSIEEGFIARLSPGECFLFAGRYLELIRVRDTTAYVKRATGSKRTVPRWQGGHLPLSTTLATAVQQCLADARDGQSRDPELHALSDLVALQQRWSHLPGPNELLIERTRTRDGEHLFIFPFAGRLAHEGLASLLAWRLGRDRSATFGMAVNDYGLQLVTGKRLDLTQREIEGVITPANLADELEQCLNADELARRRFREIARIAGMVFTGYPGRSKGARQLQASSGLIFDTLQRYAPEHQLLAQAREEVLSNQLEYQRLTDTLAAMASSHLVFNDTPRLTPLAFPLWAERQRNRLSSEDWQSRIERMIASLERAAG